jgi:hypothetical protein
VHVHVGPLLVHVSLHGANDTRRAVETSTGYR